MHAVTPAEWVRARNGKGERGILGAGGPMLAFSAIPFSRYSEEAEDSDFSPAFEVLMRVYLCRLEDRTYFI